MSGSGFVVYSSTVVVAGNWDAHRCWVVAEDWPSQWLATLAAQKAAFQLRGRRRYISDEMIDEIIRDLGIDPNRPYGMDIRCTARNPARRSTKAG